MNRPITRTVAAMWLCLLAVATVTLAAPQSTDAPTVEAAEALQEEGRWEEAAEVWGWLADENPENATAWFNRGYCLHAAGRLNEAIQIHQVAAEFDEYRGIALYNLGCAYAMTDRPEAALDALAASAAAGFPLGNHAPNDSDLESLRGDPFFQQLMAQQPPAPSGVQAMLQQAVVGVRQFLHENAPEVEQQIGMAIQGLMEKAGPMLAQLHEKLSHDPRFAPVAQMLEQMLHGQSQPGSAQSMPPMPPAPAPPAIQVPTAPPAAEDEGEQTVAMARELMESGEYNEAIASFKKLIERDPESPEAWFGLAYSLHMKGEYAHAIEAHKKAAEFEAVRGISLYNLACAYAITRQTDKAFEALEMSRDAGFDVARNAAHDGDLKNLHDDPRFAGFLEE